MKNLKRVVASIICLGATGVMGMSTVHGVGKMVEVKKHLAALELESQNLEEEKEENIVTNKTEEIGLQDGIYEGVGQGFGGEIKVEVIIKNGVISSIQVLSHQETPEYFEKASSILENMKANSTYKVDTISGATLSSIGLKDAVKDALSKAGVVIAKEAAEEAKIEEKKLNAKKNKRSHPKVEKSRVSLNIEGLKDGIYEGQANGFKGPITVAVTVEDGQIKDIEVLGYNDDSPFIDKAMDLIPLIISQGAEGVDTVSGATYSSRGLLNAVANALGDSFVEEDSEEEEEETVVIENRNQTEVFDKDTLKKGLKDGRYKGISKGFKGELEVEVLVENGKVKGIKILKYKDDQSFVERAQKLIPGLIKSQGQNTDTVSGATYSSKAIISATQQALLQAGKKDIQHIDLDKKEPPKNKSEIANPSVKHETKPNALVKPDEGKKEPSVPDTKEEVKVEQKDPVQNFIEENKLTHTLADGLYVGYGIGYKGKIKVSVQIENHQIVDIKVGEDSNDYSDDIQPFRGMAVGVIPYLMDEDSIQMIAVISVYRQLVDEIMASKAPFMTAKDLLGEHYVEDLSSLKYTDSPIIKVSRISSAVKSYLNDQYHVQPAFDSISGATMSGSGINDGVLKAILESIDQSMMEDGVEE